MEDFDESLRLEFGIKRFVARVDANGFESNEFRRRRHPEDVAVPNEPKHVGGELQIPAPDKEALAAHGREKQEKRARAVFIDVGANDIDERCFVEVVVNGCAVLDVDTQQREVEIEMLSHSTQRTAAAPDHHQIGFVFQKAGHMVGQSSMVSSSLTRSTCSFAPCMKRGEEGVHASPYMRTFHSPLA